MSSSPENPQTGPMPELPKPEYLTEVIPGFEVTAFLAQGGMGAIFRGIQTKLDRPVAIKVLPRSYGDDFNYADRFETEAKAMAKLSHNNIVSVYDYGETTDEAFLFFVMEFVQGNNLFQLLQQGPLETDQTIKVLRQVCAGLQYAHEHGIIHRDIKPSNILVDQRGTVKMADFGLAKVRGVSKAGEENESTVLGTPDYIAPESLIEGIEIDYRADIYSVGVLAYKLLTNQLPTENEQKPPSQIKSGVDRRFDQLIRHAMMEDRGARFQSVAEIDKGLAEISKAPKLITGQGKAKAGPKAPRGPRPPAVKSAGPAKPTRKPTVSAATPAKTPPRKVTAPSKKKTPAAPKKKIALPAAQASAAPAASKATTAPKVTAPVKKTAGGGPGITHSSNLRTRARRPVPQKSPTQAMVVIGGAFFLIILIGALMLWLRSRDKAGDQPPPQERLPAKKKEEDDGSFFGVPVSSARDAARIQRVEITG